MKKELYRIVRPSLWRPSASVHKIVRRKSKKKSRKLLIRLIYPIAIDLVRPQLNNIFGEYPA